jgi:spore coat protein U-like protein
MSRGKCTMTVTDVNFGTYDTFSDFDVNITGGITVRCNQSTPYTISLSAGSGSYLARHMTNSVFTLSYNLYLDPQRITIWGNGSGGTGIVSDSGTGGNYTIYGQVPARQNVYVGNYSDTVIVTVVY